MPEQLGSSESPHGQLHRLTDSFSFVQNGSKKMTHVEHWIVSVDCRTGRVESHNHYIGFFSKRKKHSRLSQAGPQSESWSLPTAFMKLQNERLD